MRDGFDRASQILDLTANELKTDGQNAAEFSEKLLSHTTRFQDVAMNAVRGVLNTSKSNLDYVEGTTKHQFNGLTIGFCLRELGSPIRYATSIPVEAFLK